MAMFGGGEGVLAGLQAEQTMGNIAMQPYEQQIKQAQAQQAQMKLQKQQNFDQLVQQANFGQSGNPQGVDRIQRLAEIAAVSGMPDEAAKLMNAAYLGRLRGVQADAALTRIGINQINASDKAVDLAARLTATAHDTESLHAAARTFRQMAPGQGQLADYIESQEYSPELIDQINQWAISKKDQANLAIKSADEQSKERNRSSQEDFRDFKKGIETKRVDIAERRLAATTKAGGKSVTSPSAHEQNDAAQMIKEEFPDLDSTSLMQSAFAVAAQARAIVKDNPGLDFDQAMHRAFEKAKADGDFIPSRTGGLDIPFIGKVGERSRTKFQRSDSQQSSQKMIKTPRGEMNQQSVIDAVLKANPGKKIDDPEIQAILKKYGIASGSD